MPPVNQPMERARYIAIRVKYTIDRRSSFIQPNLNRILQREQSDEQQEQFREILGIEVQNLLQFSTLLLELRHPFFVAETRELASKVLKLIVPIRDQLSLLMKYRSREIALQTNQVYEKLANEMLPVLQSYLSSADQN